MWKTLALVTNSESPVVVVLSSVAPVALAPLARSPPLTRAPSLRARTRSGSMEPAFYRGDILFLTNPPREKFAVGDITVFNVRGANIPIVHRVIEAHDLPCVRPLPLAVSARHCVAVERAPSLRVFGRSIRYNATHPDQLLLTKVRRLPGLAHSRHLLLRAFCVADTRANSRLYPRALVPGRQQPVGRLCRRPVQRQPVASAVQRRRQGPRVRRPAAPFTPLSFARRTAPLTRCSARLLGRTASCRTSATRRSVSRPSASFIPPCALSG